MNDAIAMLYVAAAFALTVAASLWLPLWAAPLLGASLVVTAPLLAAAAEITLRRFRP